MKISVFGLGYVGAVVTACLARDGHEVIGVDTDAGKVAVVNDGHSPIVEPGVEELMAAGVKTGRISATTDHKTAVLDTEMSLICVGTPSKPNGELDLTHVVRVCESIGAALKEKTTRHLVIVRSTMLPGSVEGTVIPALESSSGKKCGSGFGVAINPEFLREGTAIYDFDNPPKTVIGSELLQDAEKVASLYAKLEAPLIMTSLRTAEMVKYTDNVFHALKVTFANEIGALCKELGVDGAEVMSIFCKDRKLNLSEIYLKPGFAYGGSCLPKDLRALTKLAQNKDVRVPVLEAIAASNELQIQRAARRVLASGCRKVGVLGFAFKGGTDDLRESPVVTLIEVLLGKGCELKLYDPHVALGRLVGANRRYIEQHVPHLSKLMAASLEEVVQHGQLILIGNHDSAFDAALEGLGPEKQVIDLRPARPFPKTAARYERISS